MPPLPYPSWRKWLSYVHDQTLVRGEGDYGDELAVVLRKGKLLLQSNGAVYSWEDNYYNFRTLFERFDWDALQGDRVLLLGLGLGSVPQMTEELFGLELSYVAVEYDEAVAALAEEYLLYRLRSPITVIVADAEAFVAQADERFDLVLVDLFVDDTIPGQFVEKGFAERLAELLRPGGCIVSNRLTYRPQDEALSREYYRQVWSPLFPGAAKLDVGSNWMLLSDGSYLLGHVPEAIDSEGRLSP